MKDRKEKFEGLEKDGRIMKSIFGETNFKSISITIMNFENLLEYKAV